MSIHLLSKLQNKILNNKLDIELSISLILNGTMDNIRYPHLSNFTRTESLF